MLNCLALYLSLKTKIRGLSDPSCFDIKVTWKSSLLQ